MKTVTAALILYLALTAVALAHKVNVFAVAEGGVVSGEGYFPDGIKAQNAQVRIMDANGAMVADGRTAADGTFRIALPPDAPNAPWPLRVVLTASEGHQNEFTLAGPDAGAGSKPVPAGTDAQGASVAVQGAATSGKAPAPADTGPGTFDESRLAAVVDAAVSKALEERLTPVRLVLAKLAAQDDGVRMRDIVGGLGWIIGLVGLAAWFKRPGKKS